MLNIIRKLFGKNEHFLHDNLLERIWVNKSAVFCVRTAKILTFNRVADRQTRTTSSSRATQTSPRSWHSRSSNGTAWSNLHISSGHGRSSNTRCHDIGRSPQLVGDSSWFLLDSRWLKIQRKNHRRDIDWLGSSWITRRKVTFGCQLGPLPPTCYLKITWNPGKFGKHGINYGIDCT